MSMKGNTTVAHVLSIAALCGSVAAPIVWGGKVDKANALQDYRIEKVEQLADNTQNDLRTLDAKLNALLVSNGINPSSVIIK